MTLPTNSQNPARPRAFTLVELLLVLTLLTVVISVAAPSLSRFFKGRYVDSEAQRFLELTRYAHSRAIAEGIPMILWVNIHERTYGLHAEESYVESDPQAVEYSLAANVNLFVTMPDVVVTGNPNQQLDQQTSASNRQAVEGLLEFRILPTGVIGEDSPPLFEIRIVPNRNRLYYEIEPRTL
jgi:prepilin-type N-terminal cleavage/methylation domain-containing protein